MAFTEVHACHHTNPEETGARGSPGMPPREHSWRGCPSVPSKVAGVKRRYDTDSLAWSNEVLPPLGNSEEVERLHHNQSTREESAQDTPRVDSPVSTVSGSHGLTWLQKAKFCEALRIATDVIFCVCDSGAGSAKAVGMVGHKEPIDITAINKVEPPDGWVISGYVLQAPYCVRITLHSKEGSRPPTRSFRLRRRNPRQSTIDLRGWDIHPEVRENAEKTLRILHFLTGVMTPTNLHTKVALRDKSLHIEVSGYKRIHSRYLQDLSVSRIKWDGAVIHVTV